MHRSQQKNRQTPKVFPRRANSASSYLARAFGHCLLITALCGSAIASASSYKELVDLFGDWRAFEKPPLLDGAPDYTAKRLSKAHAELPALQNRLNDIDTSDWPIDQQVDWHVLRAEMNGFDFNHRILKPWARDPAYYQTIWAYRSDVPAHEGPTHHAILELWTYDFPLSQKEESRIIRELKVIPPLMKQAQGNLTGNARDLWVAGIRNIEDQGEMINVIRKKAGEDVSEELNNALEEASTATSNLVTWLQAQAPSKTGPSGIGADEYSWYQSQVHYLPIDFKEETLLLERELDRSWSSLKLEEHRNRHLPQQKAADSPEAYDALVKSTSEQMLRWFDEEEVLPMRDYMAEELVAHLGGYEPEDVRNFFTIGTHYDPRPLLSHFYHWFDLAEIQEFPHPSPIRRGPLLYNIFDSRNEGTATGVEEMFMHAGLYEESPRSRELVWIMLAQRAARGLGSLKAHANEMTMAEAGTVHVEWTPRGWMSNEPELLKFEQHLYLRQPGYGTSYVTGKYLLERLLAKRTQQMEAEGKNYTLSMFFEELRDAGSVPISLVHWQLTGDDSDIRKILSRQ
ncbi:hypothetical protein R0137_16450 [Congregibacter brevis]|uniref:DUF885 domain-containing protein n=1 Tax=Congregibacter brevis TaxID=3081201 RepID=A0ABZ0ICQ1_9GAMM|nr:hypothetical protein R0137_16450 [Congregibacter sp. IMCC45268]